MFLCGFCQEPPILLFGFFRDGGDYCLDQGVRDLCDAHLLSDEESEDAQDAEEADEPIDVFVRVVDTTDLVNPNELRRFNCNIGAPIHSYMPGVKIGQNRTNLTREAKLARQVERCNANKEKLIEMLWPDDRDSWPDDFSPGWPAVRQRELDTQIYDKYGKLLRGGAHVPLIIATLVECRRSAVGTDRRQQIYAAKKMQGTKEQKEVAIAAARACRSKSVGNAPAPKQPQDYKFSAMANTDWGNYRPQLRSRNSGACQRVDSADCAPWRTERDQRTDWDQYKKWDQRTEWEERAWRQTEWRRNEWDQNSVASASNWVRNVSAMPR